MKESVMASVSDVRRFIYDVNKHSANMMVNV